jgi:hypothetical protein
MSAYGPSSFRPTGLPKVSTTWRLEKPGSPFSHLTLHHLTKASAEQQEGLIAYTHSVFAAEVAAGLTYPQEVAYGETYSREAFEAYVWGADVVVAIGAVGGAAEIQDAAPIEGSLEEAKQGRSWEKCLVGWYYVKPNYPGRSSHVSMVLVKPILFYRRWHLDLQRRVCDSYSSPPLWVRQSSRVFLPILWPCSRLQGKRFQSSLYVECWKHTVRWPRFLSLAYP